jgi:N-acetylneuraminic acid mutarotase
MFDEALMYGLSGHTSTVIGSKIYIFGGMQSDGKYSTSLLEVETDQNRIHTSAYQKLKRNGLINSIGQNG